jgi:hypothetical protein
MPITVSRQPFSSIETLFLFPYYSTREQYEAATGKPAPAWDPARPPKYWLDPNALDAPRRTVVYDSALAINESGHIMRDSQDLPQLDVLVLPREIAASVNIPPKGPGAANIPGADQPEVQMPLRALRSHEELFFRFGNTIAVRDKNLYPQTQVGFLHSDRELLQAIARKLGVS